MQNELIDRIEACCIILRDFDNPMPLDLQLKHIITYARKLRKILKRGTS